MVFDGQTRVGAMPGNLTFDGHARFGVVHGDQLLCVQTALLGSKYTSALRGTDFNIRPFPDTITGSIFTPPRKPAEGVQSSAGGEESAMLQLLDGATRPVELTAAIYVRPGRPSSSIAEHEHSFSTTSARVVVAVEASSQQPARLLLTQLRFAEAAHAPIAAYAFSNASLTGGQPVAYVAALAQMASPAHANGVLLTATSTGHVVCLALPPSDAPARLADAKTPAPARTLEHIATMGPLAKAAVDVCGDSLSLPYAAACDSDGDVVAWMLTHSRNGVASCEQVFALDVATATQRLKLGAARVVRMRGGVLIVGDDAGAVTAYNLETRASGVESDAGAVKALVGFVRACAAPITAMDISHSRDWVVVGGEDCRVHVLQFPRAQAPHDETLHAAHRTTDRPILLFSVAINVPVLGLAFTESTTLNPSFCASLMEMPYLCYYRHVTRDLELEPTALAGARSVAPQSRALSHRTSAPLSRSQSRNVAANTSGGDRSVLKSPNAESTSLANEIAVSLQLDEGVADTASSAR